MTTLLDEAALSAQAIPQSIELRGRQTLTITRAGPDGREDVLELTAPGGRTTLLVRVGPEGTKIELGAASLAMKVTGELAVDAGRIALHGREGFSITTGGDLVIRSDATLLAQAVQQKFVATLGDISLYANDDVKVDGERIRMNC